MRPVKLVIPVIAALLCSASVGAQTPPSFSGRWVLVPDASATAPVQRGGRTPPGPMGSGWGPDITVTQDATTLTVEYAQFARGDGQPPMRFVYRLDGSESKNTVNMGRGPQEQVSRAVWDGNRLVITTSFTFQAAQGAPILTSETRRVLSLESPTSLVIETTRSGVMGGPASTAKTTYRKN